MSARPSSDLRFHPSDSCRASRSLDPAFACLAGCWLSGWILSLLELESALFVSSPREARNHSAANGEMKTISGGNS
jgi:hypothetical protein